MCYTCIDHSYCKIEDMGVFVGLKWDRVSVMNLVNCKLTEKGWMLLCLNADNFPSLRILWICTTYVNYFSADNFIENMQLDHLYKFPKL